MDIKEESKGSFLDINKDHFLPNLSVDAVVLGLHEGELKVLLSRPWYSNKWMLPGGFILKDDDVNEGMRKILFYRTGLKNIYIEQFYLFGDPKRVSIEENKEILNRLGFNSDENDKSHWFLNRFVTLGYIALVEYEKVRLKVDEAEDCAWFNINEVPNLYIDHNQIINKASLYIRTHMDSLPLGFYLLPEKFTMTQLRKLYEVLLGETLDRRNFQRKVLATNLLQELDEKSKKKGVKSSTLYKYIKDISSAEER